jgi:CO dehydrogenase nickel-insertion accessory protein CooC1
MTAERISGLAKQLPITVKNIGVIWNRADKAEDNRKLENIEVFGYVPYDKTIFDASMQGKTVFDIELSGPAFLAVRETIEHQLNLNQ